MLLIKIHPHSFVDLITNSSTELFVVNTHKSAYTVREMFREKCEKEDDLDWFDTELSIYSNDEEGSVTIYSFLNETDWFYNFIHKHFTVISHD